MRVWDIHPGYLSRQSLLGQHAEIHAIYNITTRGKKGYAGHPETQRWKKNIEKLKAQHDLTVKEMALRGFNHNSPCPVVEDTSFSGDKLIYVDHPVKQFILLEQKYKERGQQGRIPLPKRGSDFWAHHKYAVMGRGYQYYKEIQSFLREHTDNPISQEEELIDKVLACMALPLSEKALKNVLDHLWGYFKEVASVEEKKHFFSLRSNVDNPLSYLYRLAKKYEKSYLLHSTIFPG